jgi:hypothetical protein
MSVITAVPRAEAGFWDREAPLAYLFMTETRNTLGMNVHGDLHFVGGEVFQLGRHHRSKSGPRSAFCQRGMI